MTRRRALTGLLSVFAAAGTGVALAGCLPGGENQAATGELTPAAASAGQSGLQLSTEGRDADVHLVRRLTYGATEAEVEKVRSMGAAAWLDEQLDPDQIDTSAIDQVVADAFPELAQGSSTLLANYRLEMNGPELGGVLAAAAFVRHTQSPAQLYERMVEFWGDHFNVPQVSPPTTITRIVMDHDTLRPHALGRFDELLVATAQSPAMLMYLNNFQSSVGAINENYARELLELHTVGVDGGYDEDDIVGVARLLTGWMFDRDLEFMFVARNHDEGPLSILGWDRPTTGDPMAHGVDFLNHLARLPQTARFICHKLAVRFVSDDPPAELIDVMEAAWHEHDTAIAPVLASMISHASFVEAPPKFNRPWDYLMQTIRSIDGTVDVTNRTDLRNAYGMMRDLGQTLFRWPTPDGYPDTEAAWLNAGAVLARWDFATKVTSPDSPAFQTSLADKLAGLRGAPAHTIFDELALSLRHEPLTESLRTVASDLTNWVPDDVPSDDELDLFGPHLAFVFLAGPNALYR